ncbi:MAG: Type 1 glutamine amidotransferase-like domain-containing protein [Candidatus Yanofskybacteria bacterium]|nr:Type 1 glutamine amidotransferase-like domain-containing protein [Candidatus Yanofskybacteria bacterium]
MKLLLTSGGITNKSIADALFELVGKRPEDTSLVFIPTASNVEKGDKDWLINDLINLKNLNLKEIDIADISAIGKELWLPRMEEADVLFFGGGNSYHLMEWLNKSGLTEILPELLKNKVYVGLSAGSMVTGKDLALIQSQILYGEDWERKEDMAGLNFVDFYFFPHLNSLHFNLRKEDIIRDAVKDIDGKVYAMDDNSALKIVDGKIEIISEGKYLIFDK